MDREWRVKLEVDYLCPHGCGQRGSYDFITRHMCECGEVDTYVATSESGYTAGFDHMTGRILDRACAAMINADGAGSALGNDERIALHVFYQRLVWALSGDPELESKANPTRGD